MNLKYLPPILFELIVFIVFTGIWIKIYRKAKEKGTRLSKIHSKFTLIYLLSIATTLFSQINKNLLTNNIIPYEFLPFFDSTYKIFILLANWYFNDLYIELFSTYNKPKSKRKLFIGISAVAITLAIVMIFFEEYNIIIDIIMLIHSMLVFIPTIYSSFIVYKRIFPDKIERWAFFNVFLTCFFFILVWIINILNSLIDAITNSIYNELFYVSWSFVMLAIISSYLGFGFPKWFRKLLNPKQ